ncbi:hypothetical protein ACLK1T_19840 [Escherichia coli]
MGTCCSGYGRFVLSEWFKLPWPALNDYTTGFEATISLGLASGFAVAGVGGRTP